MSAWEIAVAVTTQEDTHDNVYLGTFVAWYTWYCVHTVFNMYVPIVM